MRTGPPLTHAICNSISTMRYSLKELNVVNIPYYMYEQQQTLYLNFLVVDDEMIMSRFKILWKWNGDDGDTIDLTYFIAQVTLQSRLE